MDMFSSLFLLPNPVSNYLENFRQKTKSILHILGIHLCIYAF